MSQVKSTTLDEVYYKGVEKNRSELSSLAFLCHGHRQWPCCLLLLSSTKKMRPIKVGSREAKTTDLKMPIALEAFDWQNSEIAWLGSVTEIRDGCEII